MLDPSATADASVRLRIPRDLNKPANSYSCSRYQHPYTEREGMRICPVRVRATLTPPPSAAPSADAVGLPSTNTHSIPSPHSYAFSFDPKLRSGVTRFVNRNNPTPRRRGLLRSAASPPAMKCKNRRRAPVVGSRRQLREAYVHTGPGGLSTNSYIYHAYSSDSQRQCTRYVSCTTRQTCAPTATTLSARVGCPGSSGASDTSTWKLKEVSLHRPAMKPPPSSHACCATVAYSTTRVSTPAAGPAAGQTRASRPWLLII